MSDITSKTRHAILLVLGEARNLVAAVPSTSGMYVKDIPPNLRSGIKFRMRSISSANSAKRYLEAGKIDYAWHDALRSLEAARIANLIHHFGPDPKDWTD